MRATMQYYYKQRVAEDFDTTVEKTRAALAEEGFGILSEIDVAAKMQEKLGKQMEPYLILGACAPPLAWKALGAEKDLGVMLPCNVCVYVEDGQTVVSAMEPKAALGLIGDPTVDEVGDEVSARLHRVVDGLAQEAPAANP